MKKRHDMPLFVICVVLAVLTTIMFGFGKECDVDDFDEETFL